MLAGSRSNMPSDEELDTVPTSPSLERPRSYFARNSVSNGRNADEEGDIEESEEEKGQQPTRWGLGVLNDRSTNEVPGTFASSREGWKGQRN
jgi:hypothetical protein